MLACGQDSTDVGIRKESTYVEFGGTGIVLSVCADRLIRVDKKRTNSFAAGFSFMHLPFSNGLTMLGVPISYNVLFGKRENHFELGFGLTTMFQEETNVTYNSIDYYRYVRFYSVPRIGYRYQKPEGGFFFRIAFTPVISYLDVDRAGAYLEYPTNSYNALPFPLFGVCLGHTHKK